jgi:hypothetical protein
MGLPIPSLSPLAGRIIGYRKNGLPIYLAAGADPRGDELLQLRTEAADLATQLADDDADESIVTRAVEVADRIETLEAEVAADETARTERAERARATRARLAAAQGSRPTAARTGGSARVIDRPRGPAGSDGADHPVGLGQRVLDSSQIATFRSRGYQGSVAIELPEIDVRTLVDSAARPRRVPYVGTIGAVDQPLLLADLVDRQTTNENSIPYLVEVPAQYGNPQWVTEGALKPEAGWAFAEAEGKIGTCAHWTPITRQAFDDDKTLVGYIEGRMAFGLERKLDNDILNGDGVSPNMRGIWNTSGLGSYTPTVQTEKRIISIRKALTVAQLSGYPSDAVLIHPMDWQEIELDVVVSGRFRFANNIQNAAGPRVWGITVLVTQQIAVGKFLLGGFRVGATLWEKEGITTRISDSHAANFTSNILVILLEMRAGLTVWRPAAFVKGLFGTSA